MKEVHQVPCLPFNSRSPLQPAASAPFCHSTVPSSAEPKAASPFQNPHHPTPDLPPNSSPQRKRFFVKNLLQQNFYPGLSIQMIQRRSTWLSQLPVLLQTSLLFIFKELLNVCDCTHSCLVIEWHLVVAFVVIANL